MDRRKFLLAAAGSLLAIPPLLGAQQLRTIPRIGVLWPVSDSPELEAFRQGFRELGYVERQNIVLEYRYARGKDELLRDLAAELVGLNVDLILTYGVTAAQAARQATTTIAIVNGSMSDPVAAGLAKSLARPGGNVTGLTSRSPTGALIVLADLRFNQHLKRLVELAAEHQIPATYVSKDFVEGGGLMCYGPSWPDQFRRAAGYVDKILKGAKPADLPIEGPKVRTRHQLEDGEGTRVDDSAVGAAAGG